MTEATQIQEVFGQFAVDLGEGPVLYKTEAEAQTALSEYENGAEQRQIAADYCAFIGVDGKNAKGKSNIITGFLAWVDAGSPEAPVKEEAPVSEEAPSDDQAEAQF